MIPDNPILTKEKDLLHRYSLASRIAGVINCFGGDESLVVGIEGEWGSGKTSFINLILEDLKSANAISAKTAEPIYPCIPFLSKLRTNIISALFMAS